MLKQHDVVLIKTDNPFFHNMLGRVKQPTDYGAIVLVESHHYPQRMQWELRCINDELLYIGSLDESQLTPIKTSGEKIPGSNKKPAHSADMAKYEVVTEATGIACNRCGGLMVRTGNCMTCQSCSESSGGCG